MTGAEYIIKTLEKYNVTDAFGIPGAVILELLYTLDRYGIRPHLCYHEQSAGFAACGYAQAKNSLGVAYATKGPGFTNLVTAIADAYYDSIPVLFITAHSSPKKESSVRFISNQEIDSVSVVSSITKYAEYVETEEDLLHKTQKACTIAMENRKGPVLLDYDCRLLEQTLIESVDPTDYKFYDNKGKIKDVVGIITKNINKSRRPVILIGNGIKQCKDRDKLEHFCKQNEIPILSSRTALDVFANSDIYFGYIGSRGTRYSNFILTKCDTIISIGNRMAYNLESKSFHEIMKSKKIIRIEIDSNEFERKIPNSINVLCDLDNVLDELEHITVDYLESQNWLQTCIKLRKELFDFDVNAPVKEMINILQVLPEESTLVCDVGNNALWLSRAHSYLNIKNKVLFSMGLACLGNALCKSIGVFYAEKKIVVCIIGDQGFQMNIQELEFLSNNKIPIFIILINNASSGMIKNWEKQKYGYDLHSSLESGYGTPNFKIIAQAYNIKYIEYSGLESVKQAYNYCKKNLPVLLNVLINASNEVVPSLQNGAPCYKMTPELPTEILEELLEL